jgi:rhodanese-related sulfurtransferase/glyoxylase-like metal-dependent hydrolase (beta-lactamase superfamily II)
MVTQPIVVPVVDAGLGNSAYLVDLGDGRGLAVDASRDLRALRRAADQRGLRVAFAADTHLHADFLSGAVQLAGTDGATVLASKAGGREFAHTGLADGDEADLGGLRLRALATPGHTDEHLAFVLLDGDEPIGVFTGGSLIVGAAARTDLVDPDRTEELARAQYRSLRRLLTFPEQVAVWPTHGAGSFCSAPPGADRVSSIGREKSTNSLLRAPDEDSFVTQLLDSLGSFPPYFRRLAEINRRGPAVLDGAPTLAPLSPATTARLLDAGAIMVDVRPVPEYAGGHVPRSLSIPLRDAFATWLGWIASPDKPLIVIRSAEQDPAEVAWQAAKIGYDDIAGEVAGGIGAWLADGRPVTSTNLVTAAQARELETLDVRQDSEYAAGHVPGARHIELGALPLRISELPDQPVLVRCGHGHRAATAASLLERAGRSDVFVVFGGLEDVTSAERAGHGTARERAQRANQWLSRP